MNATEAAMQVYACKNRNVAGVVGYENLRKVKVIRAIKQSFEAGGLTDTLIAEKLKEIIVSGTGKNTTASDSLRAIEILGKFWGLY